MNERLFKNELGLANSLGFKGLSKNKAANAA